MRRWVRAGILVLAAISARYAVAEKAGEEVFAKVETRHPYAAGIGSRVERVWSETLTSPDASYIAPHFSRFQLAAGDFVVVRSPDGEQEWRYTGLGRAGLGESKDGFWSSHIKGDTAIVELWSAGSNPAFGFVVDRFARGFPAAQTGFGVDATESICGTNDSSFARCFQLTEPTIYAKSRAVARLLIQGTEYCTGWLVGDAGHLITNNHCIATASDALNTDYEFMAEGATCATNCTAQASCPGFLFGNGVLVQTDEDLDYALVLLPGNPSTTYGFLKIREEDPAIDERIYIPGHPLGAGKRISVTSTHSSDSSGFCEVFSLNRPACVPGSPYPEIGYYCDTDGGSSGSPVIAYSDHRVVSLHHCGACANRGLHMNDIITDLGANLPASATFDPVGTVKLDKDRYGCNGTIVIAVKDHNLAGMGLQSVTVASTTEPDVETFDLMENPAGSGKFSGAIQTTSLEPAADWKISIVEGDTITVTYIDANDGEGGTNVERTDAALADCTAPVLTNVQATNIEGSEADITFTSDEACDSVVTYDPAGTPPPTQTASNPAVVTSHTVHLTGLVPCTDYIYRVSCTDPSGNPASNDNGGAYFTFMTGMNLTPTFSSPNVPVAIPDNDLNGVLATIVVSDVNTIVDVNVTISITHTYDTDLVLTLIGPDNTTVLLSNRRPTDGGGVNFTDTVFDDQAATGIQTVSSAQSPYTGSFRPEQFLSAFAGKVVTGTWTLKAVDAASVDVGTLEEFDLSFTYSAQPCGPAAARQSHALVSEWCSGSGAGGGNGFWDEGEDGQISVTLRNSGTEQLTGVSAELVPLTPGVTMTIPTATYPNIGFGEMGTSHAPHFVARLPVGLACGSTVQFQIDITADQGTFTDTLSLGTGQVTSGDGTALNQPFTGGIPGTWTIVNGGSGGGAASTWTTANPGARVFVSPLVSPVAILDSDNAGSSSTSDDQLITPVMNLASATSVSLEFDQYFRYYSNGQPEKGDVDVRSSNTGGAWVNVFRNELASSSNPDHRTLDITAQAAGAADAQVRFHYYDAGWEFWWQVDNVKVTYQAPGTCNQTTCGSDALPGEVSNVRWPNRTSMSWDAAIMADSYNIYRGVTADYPKLLNVNLDSCLRVTTAATSATGLVENPSVSSVLWWLVRASNVDGEGSPGFATAGPRTQNSSGVCP